MAMPLLRRVGACARRPQPLRVRPYSTTTSTSSQGAASSSMFLTLATAAAAAAAAVSAGITTTSHCETRSTTTTDDEEEGEEVVEVMREATATATATSAPSFSEHHDRVDTKLHRAYPEFLKFHLIHETLSGKEKIEGYEVYKDRRDDSVVAFARLGMLLSGHPNIIHGGSIAALLDNTMGVAFFAAKRGNGFTANLTINYKRPILCGTEVKLLARVERVEGRKVFLRAEIRDAKDEGTLYTEATSLFITSQSPLLTGPKKIDIS